MTVPKKLHEFKIIVQGYFTAYAMANYGMSQIPPQFIEREDYNPKARFIIGDGPPESSTGLSSIPNEIAMTGMAKDSSFSQIVAAGLITLIYNLWNEQYRSAIASELGWAANDCMADGMGDVRLVRNWLVHDQFSADKKVKNLKVLSWPAEPGPLEIRSLEMNELMQAINEMGVYLRQQA